MKRFFLILPALALAACTAGDPAMMAVRDGPQSQSPVTFAGAATTAPSASAAAPTTAPAASGASAEALFNTICTPNKGNYAGAVAAANATGAFGPADTVEDDILGGEVTTFRTADGNIEAIIGTGGPVGDSCGVGSLNPPATFVDFEQGQLSL